MATPSPFKEGTSCPRCWQAPQDLSWGQSCLAAQAHFLPRWHTSDHQGVGAWPVGPLSDGCPALRCSGTPVGLPRPLWSSGTHLHRCVCLAGAPGLDAPAASASGDPACDGRGVYVGRPAPRELQASQRGWGVRRTDRKKPPRNENVKAI